MAGVSGSQLVQFAQTLLGVPYVWGGTSPQGFDCSGFVQYVYSHYGLKIPRVTYDQVNVGSRVNNVQDAQPGDLIFYAESGNGMADHVAMYMGGDQIIVADHTGTPVRIRQLDPNEKIVSINRYPGVISTTNPQAGPRSYTVPSGVLGSTSAASLPTARPTFDWWSGLGISAPDGMTGNENVGLISSFIKNDPDLQNLYSEAVAGNWSQDEFVRHLQETGWWQTNSATVRQNLVTKKTDPTTWNQTITNDKAKIQEMAVQLGVHLSANALQNVTNTAALMGYNDAMIQSTLSSYLQASKDGWFGGYAGQVELGLKEYAADQGIPISQNYINQTVQSVVAGSNSLQSARAWIQNQAASAFPAYAQEINDGMTVGQIAAPYVSSVTNILEQNPDHVDLFNPLVRKALQAKDSQGNPTVTNLNDFEITLRKTPQWRSTANARDSLLQTGNQVLSDLGLSTVGQTTPNALTSNSRQDQNLGLSGDTKFPTLQGQQAFQTPQSPVSGFGNTLSATNTAG